ncbi:ribosomal protein S18 acetylase RimI-like enzyme [Amorphus suaedae]
MGSSRAVTIRAATVTDAAEIGRIHAAAWRETYDGLLPPSVIEGQSEERRGQLWEKVMRAPNRHGTIGVFVAETGQGIAGFGSCGQQRSAALKSKGHAGEVSTLYVLRAFQRRHIGSDLMRAMAGALLDDGIRAMSLWVLRENDGARRFYKRLGGTLAGVREETLGLTVLSEVAYHWNALDRLADGHALTDGDSSPTTPQATGSGHVIC